MARSILMPKLAEKSFLDNARSNFDSRGRAKETLCFLLGYELDGQTIVTEIVYPVQNGTATKVDDLGICNMDTSWWMIQNSSTAKEHKENTKVVAWVHSHVEGAPCGLSSIDVHTQFGYDLQFRGVFALVYEIRSDGSYLNSWMKLTTKGQQQVKMCGTNFRLSRIQHSSCSSRDFYEGKDYQVLMQDLPITVVDGRNTDPMDCKNPINRLPIVHQMRTNIEMQLSEQCLHCGKKVEDSKKLLAHVARAKNCKRAYGTKYEELRKEQHNASKKKYYTNNQELIIARHKKYNEEHTSEILRKQREYNNKNLDYINKKQKTYNKSHAQEIAIKQATYNSQNAGEIALKQAAYNKKNSIEIAEKQKAYNKANAENISRKQAEYNRANRNEISRKQEAYNKANADQIARKQSEYNKANRNEIAQRQAAYNKQNSSNIRKRQNLYNKENASEIRKRQKIYNQENAPEISKKQQAYNKTNCKQIAQKERERKLNRKKPLHDFIINTVEGPIFPCICCHRLLFKNGVKATEPNKLKAQLGPDLFKSSIVYSDDFLVNSSFHICHNCFKYLTRGKRPPMSACNGLQLIIVPDALKITDLEQQLIAKRLLFMKIFKLPRTRMLAMKDKVINVPLSDSDILKTVQDLPRKMDDAQLLNVQFKRMKKMKNIHHQSFIRPNAPRNALVCLQEQGNPYYQNVLMRESDDDSNDSSDDATTSNDSTSDSLTEKKNFAVSHQNAYNETTCLVHEHPEATIAVNPRSFQTNVVLAPGEGKIPTSFLMERDYDVLAFPKHFPNGKFGCDYEREQPISKQQYFNQRMLNKDKRFRTDHSYLFACQQFVEHQQLQKQFDVVVQRGQMSYDANGKAIMTSTDCFAAFQKVKGTPKYFQTVRNELLAKIAQLGPFQLFFTLSCGEKRWKEFTASLLVLEGYDIKIEMNDSKPNILVNGTPIDEFLNANHVNQQDMLKDNIFMVTRMFDHRVKQFVQHILMSKKTETAVEYYTYRVEFQMRGMAHIHGVLWLRKSNLEQYMVNGTQNYDDNKMPSLIDSMISCSLSDETISDIVSEVQVHHHTKSCRKYNMSCRFGYPRFPSDETIIAKPLPELMDEKEREKKMVDCKDILQKVKKILECEDIDENMTLSELLRQANVSPDDYKEALGISERGTTIVLKRSVKERYVNNYNPEYLKAWNANMDLQFCYDPYAIITYICDYYGKEDSGMTRLLKQALETCKGRSQSEKLNTLKSTYLTHRQIGACEATYRLLPNLHMKDSNITCIFVSTGFPENRSTFLKRIDDNQDSDGDEDEDVENTEQSSDNFVKLNGQKGTFRKAISIHEKYAGRPKKLENMCLAQFASHYTAVKKTNKKLCFVDDTSEECGSTKMFGTNTYLPLQIILKPTDLGIMQLRQFPCVLRLHESKKKKEDHEFYYSEMLLFLPWRVEDIDLHRHASNNCMQKYVSNFRKICLQRKECFPFADEIEAAKARLDEVTLDQIRPTHITDHLDPEGTKENSDDDLTPLIHDLDYSVHPGNFEEKDSDFLDTSKYKTIDIDDMAELYAMAQQLIPEQQIIFQKIIAHCKYLVQTTSNGSSAPDPLQIIVHGGAGTGKSNIIRAISKWAEYTLRKAGDHPNKPRILLTAPTGMAASVIGGMTLHSALNLNYGDDLKPLSDKKLDEMRCLMSDLKILILDEMSMVRSDMLYQIHARLAEIFNTCQLFGGVSILLVGDLLQLKPVRGSYIFQEPYHQKYKYFHSMNPLWESFEVYCLVHNHRQGEQNEWADTLNRLRVGNILEDQSILQRKIITPEEAKKKSNACHIYYTNKEVDEYNVTKLNAISSQLFTITATVSVPLGCKTYTDPSGRIDKTAFMKELNVKKGARVMLIHNVNVVDNLANGAIGTIIDIRINKSTQKVESIIVDFDNEKIGMAQRERYAAISNNYKNVKATPIFRAEFQYQLPRGKYGSLHHSATAKLLQFPLRLSWAVTAHKVQGQTFHKGSEIVVHWHKRMAEGMAYVMLGRCEDPRDVFITGDYNSCGIRCNSKAKEMDQELSRRAKPMILPFEKSALQLVLLNTRSLKKHHLDVLNDWVIQKSNMVVLTETWLERREEQFYQMPHHPYNMFASMGRGKGCAFFSKEEFAQEHIMYEPFQSLKLKAQGIQFFFVYREKGCSLQSLLVHMKTSLDFTIPIIICGDFNIDPISNLQWKRTMASLKLHQIISKPTHEKGNILDHVYVSEELRNIVTFSLYPVYYSDHSIICCYFK